MTYSEALSKRKIEKAFVLPLVLLGKVLSVFFRPSSKHKLFIFSSSADIGGSIMNNADLAGMFVKLKPVVIFSKIPKNNKFLPLFEKEGVTLWDIHKKIDYKWYHFINIFYRGVIAAWINKSTDAVVIGGESLYFHKVLPWIRKDVRRIELCHLDTWFNYSQQFLNDIDVRVFSTQKLLKDALAFYDKQGIDPSLKSRMVFIDNMVPDVATPVIKNHKELQVVFIGRGAPQKRAHLVAQIAKKIYNKDLPIHFSFAGDVSSVIETKDYPYCTFYGNVEDRNKLKQIQEESDVLLLTSAYEGLPMVVMEMMALGKAIVSTAINAIPDYIKDGVNGFLITNEQGEKMVVEDSIIALSMLMADHDLLFEIGMNNFKEAKKRFGKELFQKKWQEVIEKRETLN